MLRIVHITHPYISGPCSVSSTPGSVLYTTRLPSHPASLFHAQPTSQLLSRRCLSSRPIQQRTTHHRTPSRSFEVAPNIDTAPPLQNATCSTSPQPFSYGY